MQLDYVRSEIERMRTQIYRQRGEIRQLQRAGISTASAEALLERVNRRWIGTPYRHPKGTPLIGVFCW